MQLWEDLWIYEGIYKWIGRAGFDTKTTHGDKAEFDTKTTHQDKAECAGRHRLIRTGIVTKTTHEDDAEFASNLFKE